MSRRIKKEHIHEGLFFARYLLLLVILGLCIALAYITLYILPQYEHYTELQRYTIINKLHE